jgi:transcriptional regulator GlxA family with amidase domain
MRVSRRHIDRLFELELREPLMTFVRRVRVEAAIDLRLRTGDKLESIAPRTGFADAPSLSHACRRLHGRALGTLAEERRAALLRRLA